MDVICLTLPSEKSLLIFRKMRKEKTHWRTWKKNQDIRRRVQKTQVQGQRVEEQQKLQFGTESDQRHVLVSQLQKVVVLTLSAPACSSIVSVANPWERESVGYFFQGLVLNSRKVSVGGDVKSKRRKRTKLFTKEQLHLAALFFAVSFCI